MFSEILDNVNIASFKLVVMIKIPSLILRAASEVVRGPFSFSPSLRSRERPRMSENQAKKYPAT